MTAISKAVRVWVIWSVNQDFIVRLDRRPRPGETATGAAMGTALFSRIHQPSVGESHRTGVLLFGDQRAMSQAGGPRVWFNGGGPKGRALARWQ